MPSAVSVSVGLFDVNNFQVSKKYQNKSSGVAGVQELQNGSLDFRLVGGPEFLPFALDPNRETFHYPRRLSSSELLQLLNSCNS
jgi:hypothetical protein